MAWRQQIAVFATEREAEFVAVPWSTRGVKTAGVGALGLSFLALAFAFALLVSGSGEGVAIRGAPQSATSSSLADKQPAVHSPMGRESGELHKVESIQRDGEPLIDGKRTLASAGIEVGTTLRCQLVWKQDYLPADIDAKSAMVLLYASIPKMKAVLLTGGFVHLSSDGWLLLPLMSITHLDHPDLELKLVFQFCDFPFEAGWSLGGIAAFSKVHVLNVPRPEVEVLRIVPIGEALAPDPSEPSPAVSIYVRSLERTLLGLPPSDLVVPVESNRRRGVGSLHEWHVVVPSQKLEVMVMCGLMASRATEVAWSGGTTELLILELAAYPRVTIDRVSDVLSERIPEEAEVTILSVSNFYPHGDTRSAAMEYWAGIACTDWRSDIICVTIGGVSTLLPVRDAMTSPTVFPTELRLFLKDGKPTIGVATSDGR